MGVDLRDGLEAILRAGGPSIRVLVRRMAQEADALTAAELAEGMTITARTAERGLAVLAERGLADVSTEATGKRGRPARRYIFTAEARAAALGLEISDPSPLLAETLAKGAEALRRAEARLEAERTLLADAFAVADAANVPRPVALQAMREAMRHQARGERGLTQPASGRQQEEVEEGMESPFTRRDLEGLGSPMIADARRRRFRADAAIAAAFQARRRLGLVWSMAGMNAQVVLA